MRDESIPNEHYVKLSGKANIPEPLEIGKNYKLITQGTITSFTESDLNDGRHVIYYKYAPVLMELVDDLGESIKAKDTRKKSALFRSRLWSLWSKDGQTNWTDDEEYEHIMNNLIMNAEEIRDMYGKRD